MKYFAYGSNMLERRLRERVPSAVFAGVGVAHGYRLVFHKDGMDGSGKCTLEAASEAVAYGALFDMDDAHWARLDEAEGEDYLRTEIPIDLVGCGSPVHAHTYLADAVDTSCVPFEWYKALVVAGVLEHGLPEHYVRQLRETVAVRDPDDARRAAAWALLGDCQSARLEDGAAEVAVQLAAHAEAERGVPGVDRVVVVGQEDPVGACVIDLVRVRPAQVLRQVQRRVGRQP
jgi:hypothetical protein